MTHLTKTLALIFTVLLIVTLLTGWFGGHTASEAFRGQVLDFNPAQTDRIEIENPNREHAVVLERDGENWYVESADGRRTWPADNSRVESALSELADLQINAVVARSIDRHARYHVDEAGTRVRLSGGGSTIGSLIVGRFHFQSQTEFYTYVRPEHSDDVYTVPAFLNATIARDINEWRDKQIWQKDVADISEIDFIYPADSSFTVTHVGENVWMSEGDTLNSSLVNSIVSQLADFSADGFPETDITASEFTGEKYVLSFRGAQESASIRIRPSEIDENLFEAVADGYPWVFTLNRNSFKNRVLQPRHDLE